MSWINVVFTALVRAFFVFAPKIGILNRDQRDFALSDDELSEAKELIGTLNSRTIILSWPFLVIVALLSRAAELNKSINPLPMLIMLIIAAIICLIGVKVKAEYFRPVLVPPIIFCVVTILDVLFKLWFQDRIVDLIS